MRKQYGYTGCCITMEYGVLYKMKENSKEISRKHFLKHVQIEILQMVSEHFRFGKNGLFDKKDWHITYHKSEIFGKSCVYICHSAIEYIFIECDSE